MPLQNRVDPKGNFLAVNARGAWMGNRGILHNKRKEIIAPWKHKAWVTCQMAFKGRQRKVFSPGKYSELFFLDEATALSAGHRPCGECRRERFNEFKAAWLSANADSGTSMSIGEIDKQLHAERAIRGGGKVTYTTEFGKIPAGTFIEYQGQACLLWEGGLQQWSPAAYVALADHPKADEQVEVLTPRSIVAMYRNGFVPQVKLAENQQVASPVEINIRYAESSDAAAIRAIFACPSVYAGTLQLPHPSGELWEKRLASRPANYYSYVAVVDGEVVGEAGFELYTRPRRRHAGNIGIGVRDDYQGRGVGKALLSALFDLADNWLEAKRIELTVFTDNAAAIALYKQFGFEIEGEAKDYAFRDGEYANVYYMARWIK